MIDINKVLQARKKYDEPKESQTSVRLKALVDKYGVDAVCAASGLKVSSVVQYTTKKNSPQCSESTVKKAETILSQF
jgi:phage-related minor tail protein